MIKDIIGFLLIITSVFDALKYIWNAKAIIRVGTAKGHSRKFINAAILNDLTKLTYGIIILDLFIILSSILALITMSYLFYTIYIHYPYKYRNLLYFKRPRIWVYIINSILPNSLRKKL